MEILEVVLTGPGDDDLTIRLGHMPRLASGSGVNLVEQVVLIVQVEVLPQIAGSFLAWRAAQGHVERDQPGPLAALAAPGRRRRRDWLRRRSRLGRAEIQGRDLGLRLER